MNGVVNIYIDDLIVVPRFYHIFNLIKCLHDNTQDI